MVVLVCTRYESNTSNRCTDLQMSKIRLVSLVTLNCQHAIMIADTCFVRIVCCVRCVTWLFVYFLLRSYCLLCSLCYLVICLILASFVLSVMFSVLLGYLFIS